MKRILLIWILLFPNASRGSIEDYFGCYRVRWCNGEENVYSRRFFLPSVNTEVSNKHADPKTGAAIETLNLNFELPIVTEDRILLKFKFLEFPLPGARIEERGSFLRMENSADFLYAPDANPARLCAADRRLVFERLDGHRLKIEMSLRSRTPAACPDESYDLVVEDVAELNCR